MSCFWDAILNKIRQEDFKIILNLKEKPSPKDFAKALQKKNIKTEGIMWNSQFLSQKQLDENYQHIHNYDISTINQGYDCSICDPFLLIICELFQINLKHIYLDKTIDYTHKQNVFNNNYTISLQSNKNHMW